jgi:SAM-dependent methyltransferase
MSETTEAIYDRRAGDWSRSQPLLLSDFTARPFVLAACDARPGMQILDLGCGEGYVARQLAGRGAHVLGMDISAGMIDHARGEERRAPLGIDFRVGDASRGLDLAAASFDVSVAVFLFNYLTIAQMTSTMRSVHRTLREGGKFIFTVPHPMLPWIRSKEAPFYFDRGELGYFTARDRTFEGRIWRRDGVDVEVRCVHKTVEDYFTALSAAGFDLMPKVTELRVTAEHLALDPAFFGPLADQPLHLMFEVRR